MKNYIEALGMDIGLLAAGLFGGIASLTFIPKVTPKAAITAILGGAGCAAYVTPLAVDVIGVGEGMQNALAFLIGCMGMNIIGGLFSVTERFRRDPITTVKSIKDMKEADKD